MSRTYDRYTSKDKKFIRDNYGKMSAILIAKHLKRSAHAIRLQALKLGLTRTQKYYTEKDEEFIFKNYSLMTVNEIAGHLSRTRKSIIAKTMEMRKKGLGVSSNRIYTKGEDDFIREKYQALTYKEIAERIKRTEGSVTARIYRLKLRKRNKHLPLNLPNLTSEDLAYIAGCIDCDGFIGLYKATRTDGVVRFNPRIEVVNTSESLIEWFYNHVGGGNVSKKLPHERESYSELHSTKPIYRWQVAAIKPTKILLKNIRNRLIIKQYKADAVISFLNNKISGEEAIKIIRGGG